jgi:hypothetical protein
MRLCAIRAPESRMFGSLFPRRFDNTYRGPWMALWLFIPALLLKAAIGANSLIMPRTIAVSADAFPLDAYGPGGADAVVAFFAVWGWEQVLLIALTVLVLVRYRSAAPLMFLVLLLEHLGRKAVFLVHPIARAPIAAGDHFFGATIAQWINYTLLAAMVVGFVVSLVRRRGAPPMPV